MISLIHPSRGRAEKAHRRYLLWMNKSSGAIPIEHIISIDSDDPQIIMYATLFQDSILTENNNTCVVDAANHAALKSNGDILIYLSDDFDCPQDWDLLINEKMNGRHKAILRVNDLGQAHKTNQPVLTIPIMTRALYEELGYFFYPEYKSMWVDVDLFYTTLKYLVQAFDLVFPHEHHSEGRSNLYDETYRRSEVNWNQGALVFNRRAKKFGWPKTAQIH